MFGPGTGDPPRLSICIATFNRATLLAITIESILPQLSEAVELVVVDGASPDETEAVLAAAATRSPYVRYERLQQKGGVDQDFCRAVEVARGAYCWLFCDDDRLEPGAVGRVLREIEAGYSLVIVNARVMDRELAETLSEDLLGGARDQVIHGDQLDILFSRIVPYVSFIGSVVIRRDLWRQREKEAYFGTEFVHVGVIFQEMIPGDVKIVSERLVTIRYGNAQWAPRASEIWLLKWPRLIWSFSNVSERAKRAKDNPGSWKCLQSLVLYRALGSYGLPTYRKLMSWRRVSPWWRSCALLIAVLPQALMRALCLAYFRVLGRGSPLDIYDLAGPPALREPMPRGSRRTEEE